MEGSFGWGWVVDLKFVFHLLKPINTAMKYFLLKVEISNPGVLKESIAKVNNEKSIITRPNRSTRSEDHTEMTKLLNPNEHNDSTYLELSR